MDTILYNICYETLVKRNTHLYYFYIYSKDDWKMQLVALQQAVLRIRNDFVPDPDSVFNFPCSISGSRQKYRIHGDQVQDPTYINKVPTFQNNTPKKILFNQKKEINNYYFPFNFQYTRYCTIVKQVQNSQFYIYALSLFCWIRIRK